MDFISSGATITGVTTGKVYNVTGYEHHTGFVQSSSSTTIVLRLDATGSTNYSDYNGASVFITSGPGAGQERTVSSYNPGTRTVTVSTAWTTTPTSSSTYSIGRLRTDVSGTVAGVYSLPNGQFRIGEKQFRLIDNAPGDIPTSRTNGDATFHSQGLMQTKQDVKIQTIVPSGIQRQSVSEDRTFLQASQSVRQSSVSVWIDPLAETFLVSPQQFPQGVFISKMRLCFKSKDQTVPVTLQMRPVVNGYPSSSDIYPYGTVTLTPDKVKTTDIPDFEDASKYTDFTFATPLFLQPGEHSFVLIANSNEYETFAAEIGKKDLATGRQISEQPYGGSLFASQNGSTWTADQNSDITFRMYRKRFNSEPAQVAFKLKESVAEQKEYDVVQMRTSEVVTQNTVLSYQFNSQTLTADYAGYKYIIPAKNYSVNDGSGTRALFPATQNVSFQVAGLMSTLNPDITPFVDTSTIGFVGIKNLINNLELSNSDITLISGGSGYTDEANTTVTVTGGGGSGALLRANVTGAGVVDYLWVEDPGSGYTGTPTVTITDDLASGTGASAVITGETSKTGGPATAKYITRKVSLAEGFDSGDLRVYLTAYKPTGSGIYVYAKYLSSSDPELFEDKQWQLLTQLGDANFVSENEFDFRELTFAPGTDEIAANKITYTNDAGSSFDSFKTFAIKIVMTGEQTYDVVRIRDFRAIALPAKRLT
jgi:hypothetical protein